MGSAVVGVVFLVVSAGLAGAIGERVGYRRGYVQMALRHEVVLAGLIKVNDALRQEARAHAVRLAEIAAMDRRDADRVAWPPQHPLETDAVAPLQLARAGVMR